MYDRVWFDKILPSLGKLCISMAMYMCVVNIYKTVVLICSTLGILNKICILIGSSLKRNSVFERVQIELKMSNCPHKPLRETNDGVVK